MTFEDREFYDLNIELERTANAEVINIDKNFKNFLKQDLEERIISVTTDNRNLAVNWNYVSVFALLAMFSSAIFFGFSVYNKPKNTDQILAINIDAPVLPFDQGNLTLPNAKLVGTLLND